MPPAFVLSQDQTLRKIILFYQIIWFKQFIEYYLYSLNWISRFTSHYSIFNQLRFFSEANGFIIYHRFIYFANSFVNFFWSFSNRLFKSISSAIKRNRDLIYHRFFNLQTEVLTFFEVFNSQLLISFASHKRRNSFLIYHRFWVLQIICRTFHRFFSSSLSSSSSRY